MFFSRQHKTQAGIALVEVVIALGIIASILVAVGYSVTAYVDARSTLLANAKAVYLVEEGYEMLRVLRDDDWDTIDNLTVDTKYTLNVATTTLSVVAGVTTIDDDYAREFFVRELYRDSDDDITASTTSGATIDDDARWVEVSVGGPNGTTTFSAVLANIFAI